MGSSLTGILYYGFPIPGLRELLINELKDYDDLNNQWRCQHEPVVPEDKGDYRTPEWDEWREKLVAYKGSPDHIEIDCSGTEGSDDPHYVHAIALVIYSDCEESVPLSDYDLGPHPEHDAAIKRFCEMFGIEYRQPGWHLTALYF